MKQIKFFIYLIIGFFFQQSLADNHFGVFLIVKGDVTVTSSDGKTQKATVGLKAFEGDKIVVGPDSSTKVVTLDRNVLVVGEKSDLVLEKYQPDQKLVSIKLNEGSLRSSLKQKYGKKTEYYHISTPTSVTGVRGTDFYVEHRAAANENVICTFTGKVSYKPNESTTGFVVDAGKFIRHKSGQEVKVAEPKTAWIEKTLKSHEVTGNEEVPSDSSSKSVK